MSRTILACMAAVCFALIACGTIAPSLESAQIVTVCKLTANPAQFAGGTVTVAAIVMSDGFHSTLLMDRTCDGAGVALKIEPDLEKRADIIAMRQAIFAGVPGTHGKKISGSFTGRFEWHRRAKPLYVLIANAANDIQVQPNSE